MIDYLFLFPSQAAAQADATVGSYWNGTVWRGDVVFPGLTFISSQALSGWMMMICSAATNPALASHPNCILVTSREAVQAGHPFVISSPGLTTNGRTSLVFFPIPAGSAYPRPLGQ